MRNDTKAEREYRQTRIVVSIALSVATILSAYGIYLQIH